VTRRFLPYLAAAAVIVGLGAAAIAVGPVNLSRPGASSPAPGSQDAVPGAAPTVRTGSRLTTMRVVERSSPIVGADGALLESLGIENAGDRFLPLIPKGTTAPASAMLTFAPAPERPQEIRFHLLRGTSDRLAGNHSLGHFRVSNLPPGGPQAPRALIIFRVAGGAVQLAAVNPITAEPLALDRVPPEPHL
jgi:hypothetical protein